jgi:hypothetical protein
MTIKQYLHELGQNMKIGGIAFVHMILVGIGTFVFTFPINIAFDHDYGPIYIVLLFYIPLLLLWPAYNALYKFIKGYSDLFDNARKETVSPPPSGGNIDTNYGYFEKTFIVIAGIFTIIVQIICILGLLYFVLVPLYMIYSMSTTFLWAVSYIPLIFGWKIYLKYLSSSFVFLQNSFYLMTNELK